MINICYVRRLTIVCLEWKIVSSSNGWRIGKLDASSIDLYRGEMRAKIFSVATR